MYLNTTLLWPWLIIGQGSGEQMMAKRWMENLSSRQNFNFWDTLSLKVEYQLIRLPTG